MFYSFHTYVLIKVKIELKTNLSSNIHKYSVKSNNSSLLKKGIKNLI